MLTKFISRPSSKKTLKDGEDTFGEDFKKSSSTTSISSITDPSDIDMSTPTPVSPSTSSNLPSKYYCDLCKVAATCQEQLDMHFNGQKHKKKLKNRGLPMVNTIDELEEMEEGKLMVATIWSMEYKAHHSNVSEACF